MLIKELTIQGFKSFADKQTITFPTNGLFLITGENKLEPKLEANGVGKSSIFDALIWVLFGRTSTGLKAGDVKNWNSTLPCKVELLFDNSILSRTWNPNSLLLNNKVVTQEEVEKIINFNFDSFLYSVFISQFGDKFIDLQPADKMEVLSSVLDFLLLKWDRYYEKAKDKVSEFKIKISKLEDELLRDEGEYTSLLVDNLKREYNKWEDERTLFIKEKEEELKNLKKDYEVIPLPHTFNDAISSSIEEKSRLEDEFNHLNKNLEVFNNEKSVLLHQINELTKSIEMLTSSDGNCPLCNNNLSENNKIALIMKEQEEIKTLTAMLALKNNEISKLKYLCTSVETKIENNLHTLEGIRNNKAHTLMVITLVNEKIEEINRSIERKKNELNKFSKLLEETNILREKIKNTIQSKKVVLEKYKKLYTIYDYWVKGFREIKLMLTEEALLHLEIMINTNIIKLGLKDWKIKLQMDKETKSGTTKKGFSVVVKSPLGLD